MRCKSLQEVEVTNDDWATSNGAALNTRGAIGRWKDVSIPIRAYYAKPVLLWEPTTRGACTADSESIAIMSL
jgi:hypothetical protein